ncbi:MAG: DUF4956 domain-containing protein [Flavobacteriales bacterium]|nr:DUF4956 domain-containing protein [Flavobacteriales bacterium]
MLEDFQNITSFNTDPIEILKNLSIALLCGVIIALVYRITYKGPSYSTQFVNSLILLSLITSVVIMVIGNNLATAFGLVGAMSIIRFRTAVRDVQDIVFIFFSLGIGLAAGVGLGALAVIGTVFISIVIFIVIATDVNAPKKRNYMLQVNHLAGGTDDLDSTLRTHCRDFKLMSYQTNEVNEYIQAYYHVRLKKDSSHSGLVDDLKQLESTRSVNLFFDDIDPRL